MNTLLNLTHSNKKVSFHWKSPLRSKSAFSLFSVEKYKTRIIHFLGGQCTPDYLFIPLKKMKYRLTQIHPRPFGRIFFQIRLRKQPLQIKKMQSWFSLKLQVGSGAEIIIGRKEQPSRRAEPSRRMTIFHSSLVSPPKRPVKRLLRAITLRVAFHNEGSEENRPRCCRAFDCGKLYSRAF